MPSLWLSQAYWLRNFGVGSNNLCCYQQQALQLILTVRVCREPLYMFVDLPRAQHIPVMWLNNSITKIISRAINPFSTKMHLWNFHNSFIHNSLKLKQKYPSTRGWIRCGIYNIAIKRTNCQYVNNLYESHWHHFEWKKIKSL